MNFGLRCPLPTAYLHVDDGNTLVASFCQNFIRPCCKFVLEIFREITQLSALVIHDEDCRLTAIK